MSSVNQEVLESSCSSDFDFERKFIEVLEELKLKRKLEIDNEKVITSLLDAKYNLEKVIENERRQHKLDLEVKDDQIAAFETKIADNFCVAENIKSSVQHNSKSYEEEINGLRNDLKALHRNELHLQKSLTLANSKLKMQTSLQGTIFKKFSEVKQEVKLIAEHQKALFVNQNTLKQEVRNACIIMKKFESANIHLGEQLQSTKEKNNLLTSEVISLKAKIEVFAAAKDNVQAESSKDVSSISELERESYAKLEERHKDMLNNYLEISKSLNEHIVKWKESKTRESNATMELEQITTNLSKSEELFRLCESQLKQVKEENEELHLKIKDQEKEMKDAETQVDTGIQESEETKEDTGIQENEENQEVTGIQENEKVQADTGIQEKKEYQEDILMQKEQEIQADNVSV